MPKFPKNTGFQLKPQQGDKKTLKKTYPKVDSNYLMAKGFDVKSDTIVNLGRQGHRVDAIPHTNISRTNMKGSMGEGKNVIMKKEDIWWDKPNMGKYQRGLTPPYYKKPGFLKKLFGRRGEGGLIGQEYNDETGEMENVISGELGRDATVGGNDAWGNVANIFTAGQMNRGSGKGGRLGSMFRSVKNLFTGGAKAAMRKPKMGKHYKK